VAELEKTSTSRHVLPALSANGDRILPENASANLEMPINTRRATVHRHLGSSGAPTLTRMWRWRSGAFPMAAKTLARLLLHADTNAKATVGRALG